jgi:hypothetical protein
MEHCREGKPYAKLALKGEDHLPGDMDDIQVFVGIFSFGIKVDHKLVENRSPGSGINKLVYASPVSQAIGVKQHAGDCALVPPPPMGNVAKVLFQMWPLSQVFEFDNGH